METYFDSRLDLMSRRLAKRRENLQFRRAFGGVLRRGPSSMSTEALSEQFEREVARLQLKVKSRMTSLAQAWRSSRVVRTREKVSFLFGVMSILLSALLFGLAPKWVHVAYTVQAAYLLPMRIYSFKKRRWHYFLFDLCYYVNIMNFIFIWLLPSSQALFIACYCLSHGSVASAIVTWRLGMVFHDAEKVTSMFIHIYPPFVFSTIRHFYPNASERFPALRDLPHLKPYDALMYSTVMYLVWQVCYWKFVWVNRRTKIQSGERTTSLTFFLNNKRGWVGKLLVATPPERRAVYYMLGQFVYSIVTEIIPVFALYDSIYWSATYLLVCFSVSVWNGAGFYIEVFGRKFERELEALRKELAEANQRSSPQASPALTADDTDTSTPVSPILEPTTDSPSPPMLPTLGAPMPPVPILENTFNTKATMQPIEVRS
ncbi:hypothetical protein K488DRAFT_81179 [Vararia minispora EC-137]|uniref:Uncharacterized protein n=1 Tax=Vararia minispora EC-137 TaxID=1314806 RepID=A0ACB8Q6G8_9AGAM|nr:hypothetical protein K488DRAFT_81179 [Vararia minispora EC-137]